MGVEVTRRGGRAVYTKLPDAPLLVNLDDDAEFPSTAENFTLAWQSTPSCAYNVKMADIFVKAFVARHSGRGFTLESHYDMISKQFLGYVRYLYDIKRRQQHPPDIRMQLENDKRNSAGSRKLGVRYVNNLEPGSMLPQLSQQRRKTISNSDDLLSILAMDANMIKRCFGSQATSDDEGMAENGDELYAVIPLSWRRQEVTRFMHRLDDVHRYLRHGTPGSKPRKRVVGYLQAVPSYEAPKGLPEDWYDDQFLNELKAKFPLAYSTLTRHMAPAAEVDWEKAME